MSKGPVLALAIVLALAAGAGALLFLGGGGPRGEGDEPDGVGQAREEAAPSPVGLPPEETADEAEAGLAAAAAATAESGAVYLRVLDGTTRVPVEGVSVALTGRSASDARVSIAARTDADGAAVLERVPVGDAYVVRASAPGGRPLEQIDVAVAADETTDLGVFFTGARGVVEGLVVDEDGNPVEKVEVTATLEPERLDEVRDAFPRTRPFARVVSSATSDENGAYRLEEVPTGLVALRAHAEGRRTASDRVLVEERVEPVVRRIVLERGVVLRGQVVDGAGTGVPGAEVAVSGAQETSPRETLRTDEAGRFELAGFGAPKVTISLRVTPPEGWPIEYPAIARVDEPLRLVLDGGAMLEVTAIDLLTGQPVPGAEVRHARGQSAAAAREPYSSVVARTDLRGTALLSLRPGQKPAPRVTADGYRVSDKYEGDRTRPLVDRETRTARVFLQRPTVVFGRVVWADGSSATRLHVSLGVGERVIAGATTDGSGDYRIPVQAVTRATLTVRVADGRDPFDAPVPDVTGQEAGVRVDVRLPGNAPALPTPGTPGERTPLPTASVRGRVVDATGKPVPGARVVGGVRPVWTDVTGTYHVPDGMVAKAQRPIDPDVVVIRAFADGFLGQASARVPANAGDEVRAKDLVMEVGKTLRGIVVAPDGRAAAFARVWLETGEGGAGASTAADAGGVFSVLGLRRQRWTALASAPGLLGTAQLDADRELASNRLVLRPVVDVRGVVKTARGEPLDGARVTIVFDRAGPKDVLVPSLEVTGAATGPAGEFRVFTSASNAKTLQVWTHGSGTKTFEIPKGPGLAVFLLGP